MVSLLLLTAPAAWGMLPVWCGRALEMAASHPAVYAGCSSGQCTRNVRRLLNLLDTEDGKRLGFDVTKAKLVFIRPIDELRGTRFWANYWRTPLGAGREDVLHHTVLALAYGNGHIVDLDFGAGYDTPTVADYFTVMFGPGAAGLAVGEMPAADFMAAYPVTDPRDASPLYDEEAAIWNARWSQVRYVPMVEWLKKALSLRGA